MFCRSQSLSYCLQDRWRLTLRLRRILPAMWSVISRIRHSGVFEDDILLEQSSGVWVAGAI